MVLVSGDLALLGALRLVALAEPLFRVVSLRQPQLAVILVRSPHCWVFKAFNVSLDLDPP